jgi:hypothetical protein
MRSFYIREARDGITTTVPEPDPFRRDDRG